MVDALELSDDEGRGKLRKAETRSKHPHYSQIAEWGNPADIDICHYQVNK